jgi:hypothetical protein
MKIFDFCKIFLQGVKKILIIPMCSSHIRWKKGRKRRLPVLAQRNVPSSREKKMPVRRSPRQMPNISSSHRAPPPSRKRKSARPEKRG